MQLTAHPIACDCIGCMRYRRTAIDMLHASIFNCDMFDWQWEIHCIDTTDVLASKQSSIGDSMQLYVLYINGIKTGIEAMFTLKQVKFVNEAYLNDGIDREWSPCN